MIDRLTVPNAPPKTIKKEHKTMIKQPQELTAEGKAFSAIIYSEPGLGKTTLALSAPNPILCDFDRGVLRVRAEHRKPTVQVSNYDEFLDDLNDSQFLSADTVIIDTAGSAVSMMYAKYDKELNTKDPRKVYGAIKSEFSRLTGQIRDVMNKNVIYVFHSTEAQKGDVTVTRLLCEGSAKDIVWAPCDFGGRMYRRKGKRYINFTSTDEAFAKGCHGIHGEYEIPELKEGAKNDFIERLFKQAQDNIAAESEIFAGVKEQYESAMTEGRKIVDGITDLKSANAAMPKVKAVEHSLTSEKEIGALFKAKVKELGLFFDPVLKKYTEKPAEDDKGAK
jgi:hypothetical protein